MSETKPPLSTGMLMMLKQVIHYLFPRTKTAVDPPDFIRSLFPPEVDPFQLMRVGMEFNEKLTGFAKEYADRQIRIEQHLEFLVRRIEAAERSNVNAGDGASNDRGSGTLPGRIAIGGVTDGSGDGACGGSYTRC